MTTTMTPMTVQEKMLAKGHTKSRRAGGRRTTNVRRGNRVEAGSGPDRVIDKLFDSLQGSKPLPDISSVSLLVNAPAVEAQVEQEEQVEQAKVEDVAEEDNNTGDESLVFPTLGGEHEQFNYPSVRICTKAKCISVTGDRVSMSDEDRKAVTYPSEKDTEIFLAAKDAKDNKFQKRFKGQLAKNKIKLEYLRQFKKVVLCIQKANYAIIPAEVARVQGKNVYLIWGNMIPEEQPKPEFDGHMGELGEDAIIDLDDEDAPDLVPEELNFEETAADGETTEDSVQAPLQEEADVEIPDGATFSPNDVGIVMEQTGCTQKMAVGALSSEGGDLVAAVMALT